MYKYYSILTYSVYVQEEGREKWPIDPKGTSPAIPESFSLFLKLKNTAVNKKKAEEIHLQDEGGRKEAEWRNLQDGGRRNEAESIYLLEEGRRKKAEWIYLLEEGRKKEAEWIRREKGSRMNILTRWRMEKWS